MNATDSDPEFRSVARSRISRLSSQAADHALDACRTAYTWTLSHIRDCIVQSLFRAGPQALAAAEQERDAAAKKLADTERRVVQMAKKRQAEHSAKVSLQQCLHSASMQLAH